MKPISNFQTKLLVAKNEILYLQCAELINELKKVPACIELTTQKETKIS